MHNFSWNNIWIYAEVGTRYSGTPISFGVGMNAERHVAAWRLWPCGQNHQQLRPCQTVCIIHSIFGSHVISGGLTLHPFPFSLSMGKDDS